MAYLDLESGERRTRLQLSGEVFLIGRNRGCALVLEDPQVSREHARIVRRGTGYSIEDLQSRYGTFVNSSRIESPTPLKENDVIVICGNVFSFHSPPAAPVEAVEAPSGEGSLIMSTLDAVNVEKLARARPEAKLRALLDITRGLQSALLMEEILPRVLDSIFRIFPQAQQGFILLLDPATGKLVPRASRNSGRGSDSSIRISQTIIQRALDRRQAILSADARLDDQFATSQSISAFGIRSLLCVPIFNKENHPLGILQLHSEEQGRSFTEEDLELVVSVASTVAMALENARLHQDLLARERILRETELARDVQRRFLPASAPRVPGYQFFAFYDAAGIVSGDYYGFIQLPGDRLAIALGDVSGKGIPAALLMARLSSDLRYSVTAAPEPAAALEAVNRSLAEAEIEDRFVTLLLMVLDLPTHTLTLANAGHPPPLLKRQAGAVEEFGAGAAGRPLNVDLAYRYRTTSVVLEPGSTVLAYSDGITEARDKRRSLYGSDRLLAAFRRAAPAPAEAGKAIVEEVGEFAAGEPQHDDMTLVCFGHTLP